MKLTGKYLAEHNSSFVEFEVDELMERDSYEEIKENASSSESIWQGNSEVFKNGSLMLGFDYCESEDIDLLRDILDEDSMEIIDEMYEDSQRVRF